MAESEVWSGALAPDRAPDRCVPPPGDAIKARLGQLMSTVLKIWSLPHGKGPASRVAHVGFRDGGVLVDLDTGAFFGLNPAALRVCDAACFASSRSEVGERLGGEARLADARAQQELDAILSALKTVAKAPAPPWVDVVEHDGGFTIRWQGQDLLGVADAGGDCRVERVAGMDLPLTDALRFLGSRCWCAIGSLRSIVRSVGATA